MKIIISEIFRGSYTWSLLQYGKEVILASTQTNVTFLKYIVP